MGDSVRARARSVIWVDVFDVVPAAVILSPPPPKVVTAGVLMMYWMERAW